MKTRKLFSILFLLMIIFSSCRKDKSLTSTPVTNNKVDIQAIASCYRAGAHDSLTVAHNITGKWQLVQSQSGMYAGAPVVIYPSVKTVEEFAADLTYTEYENDIAVKQGTWSLSASGSDEYYLVTYTTTGYLSGIIYICNSRLVLSNSYLDGPDVVYDKVN